MPTDTERLDWLIKEGYSPAKWRSWLGADDSALPGRNGMVFVGMGGREEIDAAIKRRKEGH